MHKSVRPIKKTKVNAGRTAAERDRQDTLRGIELIVVERAAADLRAGLPVLLTAPAGCALVMSAETLSRDRVGEAINLARGKPPLLLLTPERAGALKLRRYTAGALAIQLPQDPIEIQKICAIADPARDLATPMRGPFDVRRRPLPSCSLEAITLTKIANLLPAVLQWELELKQARALEASSGVLSVDCAFVSTYKRRAAQELDLVAQASLPLHGAQKTRVLAFRSPSGAREHLALLIGSPSPEHPPLVRIHSECLTGDLLGSLKCDCGDQLRGAIQIMGRESDGGILLYLAQEGRGIGLINKLRAYDLQDQGFDTIDANTRLGFEPDERQFEIASQILKRLSFRTIRLLTNNPDKVAALESQGVVVTRRVPHTFPSNAHNEGYLKTKARRAGHLL